MKENKSRIIKYKKCRDGELRPRFEDTESLKINLFNKKNEKYLFEYIEIPLYYFDQLKSIYESLITDGTAIVSEFKYNDIARNIPIYKYFTDWSQFIRICNYTILHSYQMRKLTPLLLKNLTKGIMNGLEYMMPITHHSDNS